MLARQQHSPPTVSQLPDDQHSYRIEVDGTTVLTADVPSGGQLTLAQLYEVPAGPSLSVLRIRLHAPADSVVLLNRATFRETMDGAADRWSIRLDQDTRGNVEAHLAAGSWVQEVTSDPPPYPLPDWTPPPAPAPPQPRRRPDPSAASHPAPPSRSDVVIQHMHEGRWDTDDLAAELSDAELGRLSPEDRVGLIAEIGSGYIVGDEDETTIDRLLETTPTSEYGAVGSLMMARSGLLHTLDTAIDGEEYKRYLTALTQVLIGQRSEADLLAAINTAPEIVWTGAGVHVGRATYQIEWTDDGRIRIRRWLGMTGFQMEAVPIVVRPDDLIVVRFEYDDPEAGAHAGDYRPMPAAAFVGLVNMQFRRDAWLAVNVGLIFGGVGGIVGGATRLARLLAALDVALNAASIGVDQYRAQLAATERGKVFLRAWDTAQMLIAVYGLARVAMHLPQAMRNVRSLWNAARGEVLEHGSVTAVNDVERRLGDVERSLTEAEQEALLNHPGTDPAGPSPESGSEPPTASTVAPPPRRVRLMHGTDQVGFEGLGGVSDGRIDVAHAAGGHQDFGRGFYLATDEETAAQYGRSRNLQRSGGPGGMTHILAYDVALEDLGRVVDIRPGGGFRADWERFLEQPPFRLPPGSTPPAGLETRRAYLRGLGAERRGLVFEEFLRSIGMSDADAIVGPLGDGVFTGITAGRETTQVCIRSQSAADRLNAIMRGAGR